MLDPVLAVLITLYILGGVIKNLRAADIFAYFGGSTLGGRFIHRKLFERLSPP